MAKNNAYHAIEAGLNLFVEVSSTQINEESRTRLTTRVGSSGISVALDQPAVIELIKALIDASGLGIDDIDAGRVLS